MEDGGIVLRLFRDFDGDLWVVCCVEASLAGGAGALDLFSWVPVLIAVTGVMKHHSRWVSGGFPRLIRDTGFVIHLVEAFCVDFLLFCGELHRFVVKSDQTCVVTSYYADIPSLHLLGNL